jgi:Zn-dependent protease
VNTNSGLQFELFGIPIKVLWIFFLTAFLLNFGLRDPAYIVVWIAIVFVSILVHELGHAFVYRRYGIAPSIQLQGFGGVTFGRSLPVGKDLLVSLAGPAVGLVIGGALWWVDNHVIIRDPLLATAVMWMWWVNIVWAIFNLLPMMPLDGGNAFNAVLSLIFRRDMTRPMRYISIVTALGVIVWALQLRQIYVALFCAWFILMNIQGLQSDPRFTRYEPTVTRGPKLAKGPKPPKQKRAGRSRSKRTPPPPAPAWTPEPPSRPPTSPISTVGWQQGAPRGRTFGQEIDTASQALADGQPELAAIAVDRARRLAVTADDRTVVDHLQQEVARRTASG